MEVTELPDLYLQSNQAGGDCQFWALAQSLNAYSGVAAEEPRRHFSSLRLDLDFISNVDLRTLAYKMCLRFYCRTRSWTCICTNGN